MTPRVSELVRAFDGCDGRLSYTERRAAPALLVEAFQVVEWARALRRWAEAKNAAAAPKP